MSGDVNAWPYPGVTDDGDNATGEGGQGATPRFVWRDTILAQYADSDRITGLVGSFFAAVDQIPDFDAFYRLIWDLDTAEGYGLDVWGRIVGINRVVQVADAEFFGFAEQVPGVLPWGVPPFLGYTPVLGFAGAGDGYGFAEGSFVYGPKYGPVDPNGGGGPLYSGQDLTINYALTDEEYLRLIYAKAAANITSGSIPSINGILLRIFKGRGNCYVDEYDTPLFFGFAESGNAAPFNEGVFYDGEYIPEMSYKLVFKFQPTPVDLAVILNSGVLPRPAGVATSLVISA